MPLKPAVLPTRVGQRDGPRQSDPRSTVPRCPPATPLRKGSTQPPPPPTGHPCGTWVGVTAGTDPQVANSPGCAQRPGMSNSPGRAGCRGRRVAPHSRLHGGMREGTTSNPPAAAGETNQGTEWKATGNPGAHPPLPPLPPLKPAGCGRPAKGASALYPPARPGEPPTPKEGRGSQGAAPLGTYATCPQSAPRKLQQSPRQAFSPAPARKGSPQTAFGRQRTDMNQNSMETTPSMK